MARDRHRELGPSVRQDGERGVAWSSPAGWPGGAAAAPVAAGGRAPAPDRGCRSRGQVDQRGTGHRPGRRRPTRTRRRVDRRAPPRSRRDGGRRRRGRRGPRRRAASSASSRRVDRAGDRRQDRQVELVPLGVERVGRRGQRLAAAGRWRTGRRPRDRWSAGRPSAPVAGDAAPSTAPVSAAARKRCRSPSR